MLMPNTACLFTPLTWLLTSNKNVISEIELCLLDPTGWSRSKKYFVFQTIVNLSWHYVFRIGRGRGFFTASQISPR